MQISKIIKQKYTAVKRNISPGITGGVAQRPRLFITFASTIATATLPSERACGPQGRGAQPLFDGPGGGGI
jgi:hypothetical protein